MKKTLLTSLACGALTSLLFANARVQIVHNSPDPAANVVDIYVNNGDTPAVNDLGYRSATGFVDLPSGQELEIDIAPGNSTSADQAVATVKYTLEDGKTYYLIADGELANGFNTYVFADAKEDAPTDKTNLTIYHGSLDAGNVDVRETSLEVDLAESLAFGNFNSRLELDAINYYVELRDEAQTTTVAAYDVPLSAFNGQALLAIASGKATGADANFGLFAVPATGGDFLPLTASTAQAQIIHNSPAAGEVDIYINDGITGLTNVPFRHASGFVEIPVGLNQKLSVNLAGTATEAIAGNADIKGGGKYTVIAAGDGNNQPLGLSINPMAKMNGADPENTDVNVFHGSTDAPAVDVTLTDGTKIFENLAYGQFSAYGSLETNDYILQVRANSNSSVVQTYDVPLKTLNLQGQALTVVASGYLAPEANTTQPTFGLFVALKDGGELVELPVHEFKARVQIVHNSPDANAGVVDIYVNNGDAPAVNDLAYRSATGFVDLPADQELEIDIAPGTSTSADQAVVTLNYTFEDGKTYYLIADGLLSDFSANIFAEAAEEANAGETSLTVYHGSLDAGTVDVQETSVPVTLADAFTFGDFSDRYILTSDDYFVELRDDAQTTTVAAYDVPLSGFDGQALLAIASGSTTGPDANFGLFAVPAIGGDFLPLEASTAKAQIIHNSPAAAGVDIYINDVITGLTNVPFRHASPYVDVPVGLNQKFSVYLTGTTTEAITISGDIEGGQNYTVIAAGDGDAQPLELFVTDGARMKATEAGNTDVSVFHGATDAPTVDVTLTDGTVLVPNLSFGEYSDDYLELATNDYVLQVRINSNGDVFKTYNVPLKELKLEGQALTVIASGYAAGTDPKFGLFVALETGGDLVPLPETVATSLVDGIETNVSVYPNPTNGIININSDVTNYQVINSIGNVIQEGNSQQIDITSFPTGVYIINIIGEDSSTKAQIIKQ